VETLTCKQEFPVHPPPDREAPPITAEDLTDLRPVAAYEESFEEPDTASLFDPSYLKSFRGTDRSWSLEGIVAADSEQFGIAFWALM